MTTVLPPPSASPQPTSPESIQPGGGRCVNLELAWGRLRRGLLRRFRPGYVRRMAQRRRGECPNCPHDIIDARDLKYWRNVCGYSFDEADDRFRWRDRLGLARAGLAEVLLFSLGFAALTVLVVAGGLFVHPVVWVGLVPVAALWFLAVSFFRDPERTIPTDPALLLSPADGTVTQISEVEEPDFPGGRALRISIFLSIFNVHINRVPRTGRVTAVRYFAGCFLDARHPECAARNEQLWVDLQEDDPPRPLRVKQISGAIARRIVCWLRPGEHVQAGDRFGMIKYGSRTEVLLPVGDPVELAVKVGDKVKGGSSVLLRFTQSRAT